MSNIIYASQSEVDHIVDNLNLEVELKERANTHDIEKTNFSECDIEELATLAAGKCFNKLEEMLNDEVEIIVNGACHDGIDTSDEKDESGDEDLNLAYEDTEKHLCK